MRKLLGGVLLLVAVGMAFLSHGALSNLWADYQHSQPATYIEVGLTWLVLALCMALIAIRILRNP
jgi:TRAP-type C4-dicarboxylate transport system permease small subunit